MKAFKILFFCSLLSSFNGFSQYGNYNNSNRYSGVNRDVARNYSASTKPSGAEIEKAKAEQLDKYVAYLKTELSLDELQVIAIKNEVATNIKNIDIVTKKETSEEDKSKEIKALMDRTEVVINSYLNAAQKEKYKILVEENRTGKKVKKEKKTRAKDKQNDAKDKTVEE